MDCFTLWQAQLHFSRAMSNFSPLLLGGKYRDEESWYDRLLAYLVIIRTTLRIIFTARIDSKSWTPRAQFSHLQHWSSIQHRSVVARPVRFNHAITAVQHIFGICALLLILWSGTRWRCPASHGQAVAHAERPC